MADIIPPAVNWPNYSVENVTKASNKKGGDQLGKDDFLKLMIAQMQYQDPLSPMDNSQMVTQMAQFTSVEQLTNIKEQLVSMSQSLGSSSGLIGKMVSWAGETKTGHYDILTGKAEIIQTMESGLVDSVIVRSGVHYLKIGDKEIELSDITQVENAPEPEQQFPDVTDDPSTGADTP